MYIHICVHVNVYVYISYGNLRRGIGSKGKKGLDTFGISLDTGDIEGSAAAAGAMEEDSLACAPHGNGVKRDLSHGNSVKRDISHGNSVKRDLYREHIDLLQSKKETYLEVYLTSI